MQQILAIKEHQQQADDERACGINHKSGEREAAVVTFIDAEGRQIARERTNSSAAENEQASNQQDIDFSVGNFAREPGKLAAWYRLRRG